MSSKNVLAQLRRRREHVVDLGGGKTVTFLRPAEAQWGEILVPGGDDKITWSVGIKQVREWVTGWSGFKESDLLGSAVGGEEPVEFDRELWDEVCSDELEWVGLVATAILDATVEASKKKAAAEKNSETV